MPAEMRLVDVEAILPSKESAQEASAIPPERGGTIYQHSDRLLLEHPSSAPLQS